MLNCTDVACILHHHENHLQSHLQDHRAHHEHQVHVMSGDAGDDVNEVIQSIINGTTDSELSSLEHVDAPNESMYMLCGVFIAMVLVALIIILLAFTISKLRKREDSTVVSNNNNTNINNNNPTVIQETEVRSVTNALTTATPPPPASILQQQQPVEPPPFLWRYSSYSNSSQLSISTNNDQATLVHTSLPCEETSECKGFRKNLRGKWRRLVKKKSQPEVYTIPAEIRDQLKQIYVY